MTTPQDNEPESDREPGTDPPVDTSPATGEERVFSDEELLAAVSPDTGLGEEPGAEASTGPVHPSPPPTGSDPQGPPPPPRPANEPYRRLYRSRRDRKIGGVAGGLANYLGIDPTLVRIAFVVLALTGASVLLYIAGWILIPEHPADRHETVHRPPVGTDRQIAIAVGVGSLGLAIAILSGSWTLLAFALIVGGLWLLSERTRTPSDEAHVEATAQAMTGAPVGGAPPPPSATSTWGPGPFPAPAPVASRPPQRITRAVLGVLALLGGLAIAASAGDWWDVRGSLFLGIAIVVIGAGVILGAVTELGARGLIPLGLFVLVLLVPVAAVDGVIDDGVGTATFQPLDLDDLENVYRHGIGEMTVDLSRLDLVGESHDVRIELGIGELNVLVADDVGGTATLTADAGELEVDLSGTASDRSIDGVGIGSGTIVLDGDRGRLDLEIDVGLGQATLRSSR